MAKHSDRNSYKNNMMMGVPCLQCKHLIHIGTPDSLDYPEQAFVGWTCKAFPEGIPYSILTRVTDHREVIEGYQEGNYVYDSKVIDGGDGDEKVTWDGRWLSIEDYEKENTK